MRASMLFIVPKERQDECFRMLTPPSIAYGFDRIRLAWGVFTGRYDALDWRE